MSCVSEYGPWFEWTFDFDLPTQIQSDIIYLYLLPNMCILNFYYYFQYFFILYEISVSTMCIYRDYCVYHFKSTEHVPLYWINMRHQNVFVFLKDIWMTDDILVLKALRRKYKTHWRKTSSHCSL